VKGQREKLKTAKKKKLEWSTFVLRDRGRVKKGGIQEVANEEVYPICHIIDCFGG